MSKRKDDEQLELLREIRDLLLELKNAPRSTVVYTPTTGSGTSVTWPWHPDNPYAPRVWC